MKDLYCYLKEKYKDGEVFFSSEIPNDGVSRETVRQKMASLINTGKIRRIKNGVYYVPYTTIFNTDGFPDPESYVKKRYLYNNDAEVGFTTGLELVNNAGLTTQNSAYREVCSNNATTKIREEKFGNLKILVYQPLVEITSENKSAIQFLYLMLYYPKYAEIRGEYAKSKIANFAKQNCVDFSVVKKYLDLYPDRVFRSLYDGGVMNELV